MTAVRNVFAIVEKEWRHYFGSPIAYVALFVWMVLFGFFYYIPLSRFLDVSLQMQMGGGMGGGRKLSMNDWVLGPVLSNMAVVTLFLMPMLTMRLFAEEKRQGTYELLATSPLTDLQIVFGKTLAALGLYLLMIVAGFLNFALLWYYAPTPPEWKPLLTGALGLLLVGMAFISLGTFLSTLTRNQIVAGTLCFCLSLVFWVLSWAEDPTAGPIQQGIAYLALTTHMEDLIKGVVDLKDLVFYGSFIGFGIFLSHQSLASQRWRA